MTTEKKITGLELLRAPFDAKHIGKLPKPIKWQTDAYKKDKKTGGKCGICGGYHHKDVVHLDYVGHAALTDRLLDADPYWYWEPIAFTDLGLPAFDSSGGLWIRLYIHNGDKVVNRLGYGHAATSNFKDIGSREKEVIGDALRNAAMRFGAALDLWHKGDLHSDDSTDDDKDSLSKKDLQQVLKDLVGEMQKLTAKDTLGFLDGLIDDAKDALEQSKKDMPKTYQRVMEIKSEAEIAIGSFPGDDNPFNLPEIQEKTNDKHNSSPHKRV